MNTQRSAEELGYGSGFLNGAETAGRSVTDDFTSLTGGFFWGNPWIEAYVLLSRGSLLRKGKCPAFFEALTYKLPAGSSPASNSLTYIVIP